VRAVGSVQLITFRSAGTSSRVLQASPDHPCYAPAACTAPLGLTRWGRVHGESGVLRTPPERHTWTTMLSVFSIQRKIRDGRLPHDGITKVWSSPSAGETCDACDTILAKDQLVMERTTRAPGRRALQFHVRCFQIWDSERRPA